MISLVLALLLQYPSEDECASRLAMQRGFHQEVVMPDGTRCDLVSTDHAIEVEWSNKWKEAPAQATLYSIWLNKKPKIILLIKAELSAADKIDILRCRLVCERLDIEVEIVRVTDLFTTR